MVNDPSSLPLVRLYRAVSFEEFKQLARTHRFEITGSSVEGKYFAESVDHALQWGNILFGVGRFRVVEVTLFQIE